MNDQFSVKRWVFASFLGWMLGVVFILMLSGIFDSIEIEGFQFYLGLGMGAGVGVAQWLFQRKMPAFNYLWAILSALGMAIPFVIFDFVAIPYKLPVSVTLGAITVAILQFTILKKYFQNALLWIFGCFISWTIAVATVFIIDFTMTIKVTGWMNLLMALINLLIILAGGIVLGLISGITLKKINSRNEN